ncbi:acetyltransferase (GNAT) family protein [Streptomyces acidiscabies]|nr:acetyltransferase (GNAT) family protein [Streptomyces acidiscabies]GAV41255.1 acetyltransferase (GNAT) family protein [Streptomyces acidiscabies]
MGAVKSRGWSGCRWPLDRTGVLAAYDVQVRDYCIRPAGPEDLDEARAVMLDTVYRDFGTGYVPRWHGDIIDLAGAYVAPVRHTLLVAVDAGGEVVATGALDSRGPLHPPNPRHLAECYPSGTTAQLRRIYTRREHRRRGLARRLVAELLDFAAADGGYRSVYLHTDPSVEGAEGFWRSLGEVVLDERNPTQGAAQSVMHFEVPFDAVRRGRALTHKARPAQPSANKTPANRTTATLTSAGSTAIGGTPTDQASTAPIPAVRVSAASAFTAPTPAGRVSATLVSAPPPFADQAPADEPQ